MSLTDFALSKLMAEERIRQLGLARAQQEGANQAQLTSAVIGTVPQVLQAGLGLWDRSNQQAKQDAAERGQAALVSDDSLYATGGQVSAPMVPDEPMGPAAKPQIEVAPKTQPLTAQHPAIQALFAPKPSAESPTGHTAGADFLDEPGSAADAAAGPAADASTDEPDPVGYLKSRGLTDADVAGMTDEEKQQLTRDYLGSNSGTGTGASAQQAPNSPHTATQSIINIIGRTPVSPTAQTPITQPGPLQSVMGASGSRLAARPAQTMMATSQASTAAQTPELATLLGSVLQPQYRLSAQEAAAKALGATPGMSDYDRNQMLAKLTIGASGMRDKHEAEQLNRAHTLAEIQALTGKGAGGAAGAGGAKDLEESVTAIASGAVLPISARLLQNLPIDDFDAIDSAHQTLKDAAAKAVAAAGFDPSNPLVQGALEKALVENGKRYEKKPTAESQKLTDELVQGVELAKRVPELEKLRKESGWNPTAAQIVRDKLHEAHIDPLGMDITSFMKALDEADLRANLTDKQYNYLKQTQKLNLELAQYQLAGKAVREFDFIAFQDFLINPMMSEQEATLQYNSLKRDLGENLKDRMNANLSSGIPIGKTIVDKVNSIEIPGTVQGDGRKLTETRGAASTGAVVAQEFGNLASIIGDIPANAPLKTLFLIPLVKQAAGLAGLDENSTFGSLSDWAKKQVSAGPAAAAPQPAAAAPPAGLAGSAGKAPQPLSQSLSGLIGPQPFPNPADLVEAAPGVKLAPQAAQAYQAALQDPSLSAPERAQLSQVASAYRSPADETRLHQAYQDPIKRAALGLLNEPPLPGDVAPSSGHLAGSGIDLPRNLPLSVQEVLRRNGWRQTVPGDPVHWEYVK